MVLVDTSVWIRAFLNRTPWAAELDALLAVDAVAGHDLVYGELLAGDSGGRHRFLLTYELMQRAPSVPHHEVAALTRARRLRGRGAGWIDMHLLASAMAGHMQLWTADHALGDLAGELGISYQLGHRGIYLLPK
jgi:predicted nucleic acid-binding protein